MSVLTPGESGNEVGDSPGMRFQVGGGGLVIFVIDHYSVFGEGRTSAGNLLYRAKYSAFGEGERKAAE